MYGVDYFFVLSGFIILNAHFDDSRTVGALKSYVFKRLNRIYVPYLPVGLVVIAAYLALPDLSGAHREWGWLTSLLLVPSSLPPALIVAWTLVYEMLFYSIFILFFLDRRIFLAAVIVWAAAIVALSRGGAGTRSPWIATLLDPINLDFILGLGAALGYRLLHQRPGGILIAAGLVSMLLYLCVLPQDGLARPLFGVGASLTVLGGALEETRLRRLIPSVLVRLGDASYAIYLTHNPVISLTARLAARVPALQSWPAAFCFVLGCGLLVGSAYHYLFERPALAAVRNAGRSRLETQPQT
jgi:peptidoglycan/LPS O-acetylase OafA/YrhL